MKKEKGITLIVLIITVIIMLILIAVVIDVAIDGHLIDSAKEAVEGTNDKVGQVQTRVDELMGILDDVESGRPSGGTTEGNTSGNNEPEGTNTGSLQPGERASGTTTYSDGTKTAVIPGGFTVSGKNGEKTIEDGLVIYLIPEGATVDWTNNSVTINETPTVLTETCDQFVWIPIKNETDADVADINDMFMCQSEGTDTDESGTVENDEYKSCDIKLVNGVATCTTHNSTLMAGRLYATTTGNTSFFNSSLTTQKYTDNSGLREPDYLTGSSYADASSYNNINLDGDSLQDEYNSIVAKICNSQGFWVGRYETSGMSSSDDNVTIGVVKGKTTSDGINSDGINNVNWYRMYKQQQNYASKKSLPSNVQSSMISGAAYDQIMLFANCSSSTTPTKNYSAVITGNVGTDCYKNIYDLCGNLCERTTEAYDTGARVVRRRRLPL